MNAGRKYLHLESLKGTVFVTSGLGGMSGAQAKAAVIAGAIGVIAEVNKDALLKRLPFITFLTLMRVSHARIGIDYY